jgi:lipoate-protein ligase A
VSDEVRELYDYDALRARREACMVVARAPDLTLVLGGHQAPSVLGPYVARDEVTLRRRRGGGGLVVLRPGDLWVDWWLPSGDPRWAPDVGVSSRLVGGWWRTVLGARVAGDVREHEGHLEVDPALGVMCFAGRGPGEVFVDGRKAVGVTQWRVREGIFLSTVLHAHPTRDVLGYLRHVPAGLEEALDHHTVASLALDPADVLAALSETSGGFVARHHAIA